jgi:dipeptidyl-peptidase-4
MKHSSFNQHLAALKTPRRFLWLLLTALSVWLSGCASTPDRLQATPGYQRYQRLSKEIPESVKLGSLSVTWLEGGKAFEFQRDGKRFHFDVATRTTQAVTNTSAASRPGAARREGRERRGGSERPDRGRQFTSATSPDGYWKAFYRDRNLWLSATNDTQATNALAITTDGSEKTRLKYGTANWVYGEELEQRTAIWWATNSLKVAFYRFDESQVRDYFQTLDHTQFQDRLTVEPYMKVGATNPTVDLLIYDLGTKQTVRVDVRDGQPFDNATLGHYVYGVSWTADGKELLFHRTNRRRSRQWQGSRHHSRGMAAKLDRELTTDALSPGWPALHLGLRAHGLA